MDVPLQWAFRPAPDPIRCGARTAHAKGVAVGWTAAAGPDHARCAWLVGCDGGRSAIRKLAGFAFPGTPPSLTMYQAVLDLDHPERLPGYIIRTSEGVLINGPQPRRIGLHDFSGPPRDREAPVTRKVVEGVLRESAARMSA